MSDTAAAFEAPPPETSPADAAAASSETGTSVCISNVGPWIKEAALAKLLTDGGVVFKSVSKSKKNLYGVVRFDSAEAAVSGSAIIKTLLNKQGRKLTISESVPGKGGQKKRERAEEGPSRCWARCSDGVLGRCCRRTAHHWLEIELVRAHDHTTHAVSLTEGSCAMNRFGKKTALRSQDQAQQP